MNRIALAAALTALALTACGKGGPEAAATTQCQDAIRAFAKNPSGADIPYARAVHEGAQSYRVIWKHGDGLRLQNGLGAKVDVIAVCVVRGAEIYALDIDGKQII